jgi:rsbT co-antagonist protein RsbR
VAQQTVELRAAFEESEQRARELSSTLAALAQREATIRQLEAPIIPVMAGVILVPLIGQSGSEHMQMVGDRILAEIVERRAYDVIIDITSVSMIDTATAQQLLQLASSVRLVGARAVLVGIRPEVAQTIVSLGISLTMPTYATLEQAVTSLLKRASHSHAAA